MSAIWDALVAIVDPLAALLTRQKGEPDAESHDKGEPDLSRMDGSNGDTEPRRNASGFGKGKTHE